MGNEVFANGNEIACKSGDGKVIAAFPDVCLSPPSPPAGPIPVPYPDTSFSKDMKNGSKTVKIDGKEVMLKDKSFYKTSPLGNEAATKSLGAGVVSHVITGKTFFVAWSMDVKFEGKNVDRHIDLTTSNHASPMGDTVTITNNDKTTSEKEEEEKCPCCGGPMHSKAQKAGKSMTADEWYNPSYSKEPSKKEKKAIEDAQFWKKLAEEMECENLHSDENDPCAKHYVGDIDKKSIDEEYEAMMSPLTQESNPEWFIKLYGEKLGKEIMERGQRFMQLKAQASSSGSIAHLTPRCAGGCPIGANNLALVEGECYEIEKELGQVQKKIADYHKRVRKAKG